MIAPRLAIAITTVLFATTGCSSPADTPGDVPFTLLVTVTDSSGEPLPGGFVTPSVWPDPVTPPASPDLLQRSTSLGRFVVALGAFADNRLDSLRLDWVPRGCDGPGTTLTLPTDSLVPAHDTIRLSLVATAAQPVARTELGAYCAFSSSGAFFSPDFTLFIQIDSITGPRLVGRWRMNYAWTQGDDLGPFEGTASNGVLALVLTQSTPWGTCTGLRLAATVAPDGTWGSLFPSEPQGCAPSTMRFDMAEMKDPSLFF